MCVCKKMGNNCEKQRCLSHVALCWSRPLCSLHCNRLNRIIKYTHSCAFLWADEWPRGGGGGAVAAIKWNLIAMMIIMVGGGSE